MEVAGDSVSRTYESGEDVPLEELAETGGVEVKARNGEVVVYGTVDQEYDQIDEEIDVL